MKACSYFEMTLVMESLPLLLVLLLSCSASAQVRTTYWAEASNAGGCQLPQGHYVVSDALIALGQAHALGSLRWRQGLCGQVLRFNCGNGPVEAVVASACNLDSQSIKTLKSNNS